MRRRSIILLSAHIFKRVRYTDTFSHTPLSLPVKLLEPQAPFEVASDLAAVAASADFGPRLCHLLWLLSIIHPTSPCGTMFPTISYSLAPAPTYTRPGRLVVPQPKTPNAMNFGGSVIESKTALWNSRSALPLTRLVCPRLERCRAARWDECQCVRAEDLP